MKRMSSDISRTIPGRLTTPASEWTTMASAIGERYRRGAQRSIGARLLLAMQPTWAGNTTHHVSLTRTVFAPRIDLSVHIRPSYGLAGRNVMVNRHLHASTVVKPVATLQPASRANERSSGWRPVNPVVTALLGNTMAEDSMSSTRTRIQTTELPIERVLARTRHEVVESIEESRRVQRRLVEQRQRVEERRSTAIVVRRAPERLAPEIGPNSEPTVFRSPWDTRTDQPGMPVSNLDIAQLTDRVVRSIDDRMHAYRERMGKWN